MKMRSGLKDKKFHMKPEMIIRCRYDELVPTSELLKRVHPRNPNEHPADQIKRLAMIMKDQGVRHPIVISKRSATITKGHGRLAAAIENMWTEFPVEYQDYDDEDQEYRDVVADNAIASWSELNLAKINAEIPTLGPFDIKLLGLKDFELEVADIPEKKKEEKKSIECPECHCKFNPSTGQVEERVSDTKPKTVVKSKKYGRKG